MRTTLLPIVLFALSGICSAETYVVDLGGGPGTDFYDLQSAVDAPWVVDGDRLLVRWGSYTGFSTDKGLSITEETGPVDIVGAITIHDLAWSPWFSMEHIEFEDLIITDCAGPVFIEGESCSTVRNSDSSDVRIRDLEVIAPWAFEEGNDADDAMIIEGSSRVELVECMLRGGSAYEAGGTDAGWGGAGLLIEDDSRVSVALCSLLGGDGGDQYYPEWGCTGGDGGHGIEAGYYAELIVSGRPSNVISGGLGGVDMWGWGFDGSDGRGIRNSGTAILVPHSQRHLCGGNLTNGYSIAWL